MNTTLDVEAPVPCQQTRSNAKGKGQRTAPKAKATTKATTKSAAVDPHAQVVDRDEPLSVTQIVPKKRGRPKSRGTGNGPSATSKAAEPVEKKQKTTPQPTAGNSSNQAKNTLPPRSLLPHRTNRNIHPGKSSMPRPKRTSAEVAEAKAKEAELLRKLEELDKQKIEVLAEMEVDEEEKDIEEEETAIRHLNDLQDSENESFTKDDGPEAFPMDEDEPLMFPDSDKDESENSEDDDPKSESVQSKPKQVSVWVY